MATSISNTLVLCCVLGSGVFATACGQKCRDQWERLRSSPSAEVEHARAEDFAECMSDNGVRVAMALKDPVTGARLPEGRELAKHRGPVKVEIDIISRWRREEFVWTARDLESVWPLMRE